MEAVAADLQALVVLVGQSVHVGLFGHAHAEFGVENGNVGNAFKEGFAGLDAGEVRRIVERAEGEAVLDDLLHLLVDEHRLGHGLAAVEHAVANGVDLVLALDDALFGVGEQGDDELDGFLVGREGLFLDDLLFLGAVGIDLVGELAHLKANALGEAGAEDLVVVHFNELIFAGRGSCVHNQYFHAVCSLWSVKGGYLAASASFSAAAWMAVMMTVFTMSGTRQPRERSLTGLRRPWSTGPMAMAPAARWTAL